jgi:hypothetical protein
MNEHSNRRAARVGNRIRVARRPRRREVLVDTTVTDSWPPRLNTEL